MQELIIAATWTQLKVPDKLFDSRGLLDYSVQLLFQGVWELAQSVKYSNLEFHEYLALVSDNVPGFLRRRWLRRAEVPEECEISHAL